ncbi:MAG TPA: chromate transporter [Candidatus Eubacterium faecavium]|nr:chromate transporter [Candidatus Eubacterium faecavium]
MEENREKRSKVLLKLFLSTLYISAFTFGGGYVIVTLFKKKFVDEYKWINDKEMLDLVAIAQSSPGAIAVNGAIVTGYKLSGVIGAAVAAIATIIPPFIVISVISAFYEAFKNNLIVSSMLEGMQAGVGAVIASVVYDMALDIFKQKSTGSVIIMLGAFAASCFFDMNVIYIILVCVGIGIIKAVIGKRKEKKNDLS